MLLGIILIFELSKQVSYLVHQIDANEPILNLRILKLFQQTVFVYLYLFKVSRQTYLKKSGIVGSGLVLGI